MKVEEHLVGDRALIGIGLSVCIVAGLATAYGSSSGSSGDSGSHAPGVTATTIKLGTSNALTGALAPGCSQISQGAQAWFDSVNAAGGINGRKVEIDLRDDAGTAPTAVANARRFVQDGDLAELGGCGTATAVAMAPIFQNAKMPYLFPYAAVSSLLEPVQKTTFSILPLYTTQATAMVSWALGNYGPGKVYTLAVQIPGYQDTISAASKAATSSGGSDAGSNVIAVGTADATPFILKIEQANPDYLYISTDITSAVRVVNGLAEAGKLPKHVIVNAADGDVSFINAVDPSVLSRLAVLSATAEGGTPGSADCVAAFEKYGKNLEAGIDSLFGCAEAQVFVAAAKAAGQNLTRDTLVAALESMQGVNVGSIVSSVSFSPTDHQGLDKLYVYSLDGKKFVEEATVPTR